MLSNEEYRARDAVGLADLVRRGEVTACEVLETAIDEIERLDSALNAVVMRNYEKARETASLLADLGHSVRAWIWPISDDVCDAASVFWAGEVAAAVADRAAMLGRAPRDGELGPLVAWSVAEARRLDSIRVMQARRTMRDWQILMAHAMAGVDVLLTPVTAEPPLKTGLLAACVEESLEVWNQRSWRFAPYTETFNVTGQPAMSVPLHQGEDGLPVGMHFAGRVGEDARLLRLARQLEEAAPWVRRRPPDPP